MNTITLTLTADEAWALKQMCADSACYWHHLWQDTMDGKRPDLDAPSALRMNRKAWDFYKRLAEMGAVA